MNSIIDDVRTIDSIKYNKDCRDFMSLKDGTLYGEYKYCNLSLQCRQIGIKIDGTIVPMESNYLSIMNHDGEFYHDLYCTGMYDLRSLKERIEDDKVS